MLRLSGITGLGCLQFPLKKGGQPTVGASSRVVKKGVKRGETKGLAPALCSVVLLLSIFVMVSLSNHAFAGTVQLPQTGQTTCYNTAGTAIACAGTGQDGDKKMGVAWPSPRFTAGIGPEVDCVTDNLTGLIWVKSPDSTTRTWFAAIDYATGLGLCGFTDWRVPSVIELESLLNAEQLNAYTWLNTQGFSNVQSDAYWSSTTDVSYSIYKYYAWFVNMGYSHYVDYDYKYYSHYVWPVRGGQ